MEITQQITHNYQIDFPFEEGEKVYFVHLKVKKCPVCKGSRSALKNGVKMACHECNGKGTMLELFRKRCHTKKFKQDCFDELVKLESLEIAKTVFGSDREGIQAEKKSMGWGEITKIHVCEDRYKPYLNFTLLGEEYEVEFDIPIKHDVEVFEYSDKFISDEYWSDDNIYRLFRTENEALEFLNTL
jgi:RecJ-like exonuclease